MSLAALIGVGVGVLLGRTERSRQPRPASPPKTLRLGISVHYAGWKIRLLEATPHDWAAVRYWRVALELDGAGQPIDGAGRLFALASNSGLQQRPRFWQRLGSSSWSLYFRWPAEPEPTLLRFTPVDGEPRDFQLPAASGRQAP